MSAGFTPGPWEYTGTVAFHDRPDLPCVVDEHRLVVAQCWDDGHSEDECEANARLIASAPDLLALVLQYRDDLRHPPTDDSRERRLSAIDAALAKASGDIPSGRSQ